MKVETYEVEVHEGLAETAPERCAMEKEAVELCQTLGLTGQLALVSPKPAPNEGVVLPRTPYRRTTKEERFVIDALCPASTPLQRYDGEAVPLRVLQVAAHAIQSGLFAEIVVRHRDHAIVKDPWLLGRRQPEGSQSWERHDYLLARWGEALDDWSALVAKAVAAWAAKAKAGIVAARQEMVRDEALLESASIEMALKKEGGISYYGLA